MSARMALLAGLQAAAGRALQDAEEDQQMPESGRRPQQKAKRGERTTQLM